MGAEGQAGENRTVLVLDTESPVTVVHRETPGTGRTIRLIENVVVTIAIEVGDHVLHQIVERSPQHRRRGHGPAGIVGCQQT